VPLRVYDLSDKLLVVPDYTTLTAVTLQGLIVRVNVESDVVAAA
jgi:hypothetical protein